MMNRIVEYEYEYNNNINSQSAWKQLYLDYKVNGDMLLRKEMFRFRHEAALERKLEAAQRTIEAQEQRIEELENDVDAFELERDQREAFEALVEFTNEDFSE